jgi:acyl-coenzyme A thioesterase PaaI-like protein
MTLMSKNKRQHLQVFLFKIAMNLFPAYRRTGGRVAYISDDWQQVKIRLKLNWQTKNYVGSIFGGSIYGAIDPIYMLQLMKILGKNYVVWDKEASIKFIKPIRTTVYANFNLNNQIINSIKNEIAVNNKSIINLPVNFYDANDVLYATITKTLYIADKQYYLNKPKA